jgi:hypothetical protein
MTNFIDQKILDRQLLNGNDFVTGTCKQVKDIAVVGPNR